ncbi:hypothetical protein J2S41_000373 [Catenuloplanes atrovinosus]|uniref:cGAS/DncV-like nucleotidyltransferase C-terminal helical domain-containing protein n=1 Tax=Catenuloplanes atrovinosus TaxID=137266 RepID=A0AAE3YJJ9_9ACTN|nr:hypothetical protein [Catenuloplanes atrovinosus]
MVVRAPVGCGRPAGRWRTNRAIADELAAVRGAQDDAFLVEQAKAQLRAALGRSPLLDGCDYEVFGQGSRVNDTSVGAASDIDLVLMLKNPDASWAGFRDHVLATLGESFPVHMGRRCLNVDEPGTLLGEMVDVLVATEHRRYPVRGAGAYQQGVFFRDHDGRPIVNFPKQHRRNGDAKDVRTGGRFKAAVRTIKRVRALAGLDHAAAPSYLLECLLYAVPDHVYRAAASFPDAYRGALGWLRRCDRETFAELRCQNGMNRLFGAGPDQWDPAGAGRIIDVLHES